MMENWLDKYKPTDLAEILGNKSQIQKIDHFIKQFDKKKNQQNIANPNLLVTGGNGVGKTIIVDLVLQENNLEKVPADLSNISVTRKNKRKKKVEKETSSSNRTVTTYYKSLSQNKKLLSTGEYFDRRIALAFDNVSNISNSKEKEAVKAIIKMNNRLKEFPIVIIANTKHNKTVNEIKKMVTFNPKQKSGSKSGSGLDGSDPKKIRIINEVIIKPPMYREVENFVRRICALERLKLVQRKFDNDNIFIEVIEHSQFDIRRLINILEELKTMYQDEDVTMDKFEQYLETSKKKDLDPGIYEATEQLLGNYNTMNSALLLYGEERATIPLMVHENYPLNIRQQYPTMSIDDQINMINDISRSISESDKIDGLIYSNQCWSLQSVHGFYSCVMPSYRINRAPGKLVRRIRYKYTQDYNKTSIKKINNKVIKRAQEHTFFKKVSIHDFLYIATILKTLLERKEFETVAELMRPYGLRLKEIESIIKIDKIKKSTDPLKGKQRTILKRLLGVDE